MCPSFDKELYKTRKKERKTERKKKMKYKNGRKELEETQ